MSVSSQQLPGEITPPPSVKPLEKLLTGIGLTVAIGLLAATLPANNVTSLNSQPHGVAGYSIPK